MKAPSVTTRVLKLAALAAVVLAAPGPSAAQPGTAARILVDGRFDDWQKIPVAATDPADARHERRLDFGRLWLTNDEHHLYLRVELGREILIQDKNELILYLDTDADVDTGRRVHGLGVELEWHFGRREGLFFTGSEVLDVDHLRIGLISAPTHSAETFEIVLDRRAALRPGLPLFSGDRLRVAFVDGRRDHDKLPDDPGGVAYQFDDTSLPEITTLPIAKQSPDHLRILSYNLNDRLGDRPKAAALRRIFAAIAPDLIIMQEVRSWSSRRAEEYVRETLAVVPSTGGRWRAVKAGTEGNVVLSPYAFAEVHALGHSAAVVLKIDSVRRLLLVILSTPCCGQESARQNELDLIMAFVRDAKTPGGQITVPQATPIALIGDGNLVGASRQLQTLVDGEIFYRDRHGMPFEPDWDGTSFVDLMPRHTHRLKTFTWHGRDFSPGRLDVAIISDSVLSTAHHFILFTKDMPAEALKKYGLHRHDVITASDHLPMVVDLVLD